MGGGLGRGGGGGSGWGSQGGCERRIEVFGKIHKKKFGRGSVAEGVRWGGVGLVGGGGVKVDVNAMLGVGGDVGYGGCEPRIEGIVQCTKRFRTILRKCNNVCGGGGGGGGRGRGNI